MEAVRARFDHLVHHSTRGPPILCFIVIGQDFEFPECVGIWVNHRIVTKKVIIVRTVDQERQ